MVLLPFFTRDSTGSNGVTGKKPRSGPFPNWRSSGKSVRLVKSPELERLDGALFLLDVLTLQAPPPDDLLYKDSLFSPGSSVLIAASASRTPGATARRPAAHTASRRDALQ